MRSKADRLREIMAAEGEAIRNNTQGFNQGRYDSMGRLDDYEELKAEARSIKEDAIERLPELIDELEASVEANGGTVYLADDEADANRYIREVVDDVDVNETAGGTGTDSSTTTVVKSKSMTSEEIDVNEALEAAGHDVVETDLGEWVLQVADETPSHIIGPALHKSRESIADLFNEVFEPDEPLESAQD